MSTDTPDLATATAGFRFDNSYARALEGFYVAWHAARVPAPRLLKLNRALAGELGLNADALDGPLGAAIFSGNQRARRRHAALPRPMPATSSAASRRSSAMAARCCWAK